MGNIVDICSDVLCSIAAKNERIVLIDCDLGKSFRSSKFQLQFPTRYFNIGIAEQNAIGIAAGLAAKGFLPIVQSFACFVALRACDQIRNSICINKLPVIIVGGNAGVSDAQGGTSHHATEDLGILSTLPNISIYSPINYSQIEEVFNNFLNCPGPVYLRLFNMEEIDNLVAVKQEEKTYDITIVSTGDQVHNCVHAIRLLNKININANLVQVFQLKPLVLEKCTTKILVVETHNYFNGLGSRITQLFCNDPHISVEQIAIMDTYTQSGSNLELYNYYKIGIEAILEKAIQMIYN